MCLSAEREFLTMFCGQKLAREFFRSAGECAGPVLRLAWAVNESIFTAVFATEAVLAGTGGGPCFATPRRSGSMLSSPLLSVRKARPKPER